MSDIIPPPPSPDLAHSDELSAKFFKGLPAGLRQQLIDETYVRLCQQALEHAIPGQEALIAGLMDKRSPMDRLKEFTRRPSPLAEELEAAREELGKMQASLEALNTIWTELGQATEDQFEDLMRATNAAYIQSLATLQNIEDWKRALERFERRLNDYIRALGQARNGASTAYNHESRVISENARELLNKAIDAGALLEDDIQFANNLADVHDQVVKKANFPRAALPRIPTASYRHWTTELEKMEIAPMQTEFNRILEVIEALESEGVAILRASVAKSFEQYQGFAHGIVMTELNKMRTHADANHFDPQATTETIRRLEERFFPTGRVIHFDFQPSA